MFKHLIAFALIFRHGFDKKVSIVLVGILLVSMLPDRSLRGQVCMGKLAFAQSTDELFSGGFIVCNE